jgi:uncharacterized protein (DUF2249 family)
MVISENTKISQLIKANPSAIEAIASINSHFNKLRNPLLRKILASRVTIKEAAKIGGSTVGEFYKKLSPLGFEAVTTGNVPENVESLEVNKKAKDYNRKLDVRQDLTEGQDPFQKIMKETSQLKPGEVLLLVNSFEPVPLIRILEKKGFVTEVVNEDKDLVHTYIEKKSDLTEPQKQAKEPIVDAQYFNAKLKEVKGLLESVDVRNLEMPLPMVTVLERLESLDKEDALFVHHSKVPHFLLEELRSRKYNYLITEQSPDVLLLITKGAQPFNF